MNTDKILIMSAIISLSIIGFIGFAHAQTIPSEGTSMVSCENCNLIVNKTINTDPNYNNQHNDFLGTHLGMPIGVTISIDHYAKPEVTHFRGLIAGIETSNDDPTSQTLAFHSGDKFTIPNLYLKNNVNVNQIVSITKIHAIPVCKADYVDFINTDNTTNVFNSHIDVKKYGLGVYSNNWGLEKQTLSEWKQQKADTDKMNNELSNRAFSIEGEKPFAVYSGDFNLNVNKSCAEHTFWSVQIVQ